MSDNDERERRCWTCGATKTYARNAGPACQVCGSFDTYELAYRVATEPTQSQSSELDRLREENRELRETNDALRQSVDALRDIADVTIAMLSPAEIEIALASHRHRIEMSRARARTEENGT